MTRCRTVARQGLLLLSLITAGCGTEHPPGAKSKTPAADSGAKKTPHREEHVHGPGPNGGTVFDLGRHHAEFTVAHDKKECTLLILGDDETTPRPVAAKDLKVVLPETKTTDGKVVPGMTIPLAPQDEKDGKATRFVGTDPGLGHVADFSGTVLGLIDGKPSEGKFKK